MKPLIFILSFVLFLLPTNIIAQEIFEEEFSFKDQSKWNYIDREGLVSITDGVLKLRSNEYSFPSLDNKSKLDTTSITLYEVKFRFGLTGIMGSGVGFGFTNPSGDWLYQYQIWSDQHDKTFFGYKDFNVDDQGFCKDFSKANHDNREIVSLNLGTEWHVFRIELIGTKYVVKVDENIIFTTNDNPCIPNKVFIGNRWSAGRNNWTELDVDSVKLEGKSIPKNKLIIIPGLGGSWNTNAMVYNQAVDDSEWKMTPFVTNYRTLEKTLDQNGLKKGSDYFVWNYDWRKPVSGIVDDLSEFINGNVDPGEKVDLVGHSLGGLVARIWAQDNQLKTGQVISLGSPHFGAIGAYEAWFGAKVGDKFDAGSAALRILLQLQQKGDKSEVETVQSYAPVLKDIIPDFSFIKKNQTVVSTGGNPYLKTVNPGAASVFGSFEAVAGQGVNTVEWVNVTDRSVMEKTLNMWPHGKPVSYAMGLGDGTILEKSAKFDADTFSVLESNHGDIVSKSIPLIMDRLGLGGGAVQDIQTKEPLVFFIGSPAYLEAVCDGNNEYTSDEMGFIVAENVEDKCVIKVVGTGSGGYHLITGVPGVENSWEYFKGMTNKGTVDSLTVNSTGQVVSGSEVLLKKMVIRDLQTLGSVYRNNSYLIKAMNDANANSWEKVLESLFKFRKTAREYAISWQVVANTDKLLEMSGVVSARASSAYLEALKAKSLTDNTSRLKTYYGFSPSKSGAKSYLLMEENLRQAKSDLDAKLYAKSFAASKVAVGLAAEVWLP